MPIAESRTNLPALTATDLADPTTAAARINQITQFLAQQIGAVQGASGPVQIKQTVIANLFKQFSAPTSLPTDPAQVVTWWDLQNFTTSTAPVKPVVGGGGGGGGSTSGGISINLVCDGDSLTHGDYSSLANPYPSKVGQLLGISPSLITNLGVPGAKTSDVIATHVALADAAYKPAIAINVYALWIGVNDYLNGVPIATTQANIQTIIAGRQAKGFITILLTNTPQNISGGGGYAAFETWRDQMRTWTIAGTSGSNYYLNTGDLPYLSNPAWTLYFDVDELHISDLGYLLIASGFAGFLLDILGGTTSLLPPQVYPGATPLNNNFTGYDINIESYGVLFGSMGVTSWNTKAIQFAAAAANTAGVGMYAPSDMYKIAKTNIPHGIRFYSTCASPAAGPFAAPGSRFVCDGSGLSWLVAAMNYAVPNGGNTGPSTTSQTFGLQLKGIICDVSGTTGLIGHWLVRQWNFYMEDCGVYYNSSAAWAAAILLDTGVVGQIMRPYAFYCATGVALGGPNSTGPTELVDTFNPVISNCAVGFGSAFAQYCNLYRGTIQTCSTAGYEGAGPSNSLFGVVFGSGGATNTLDYTELASSTPPFGGGAYVNNYKSLMGCVLNSPVHLLGSTSTSVLDNECYSTLNINSACVGTVLNQQAKMFTGITDSSTTTYYTGACVQGAGAPTGSQGIRTQFYLNTTNNHIWQCTVTAVPGAATWVDMTAAGGGGLTTINPGGLTGPTITFDNGIGTLVSSPAANQIRYDANLVGGTGIAVTGSTPGSPQTISNTAPYTAPSPTAYSPSSSFTGGTPSGVGITAEYIQLAPHFIYVSFVFNFTVASGTVTSFTMGLPATSTVGGGGAGALGNGAVAIANAASFQASVGSIEFIPVTGLPTGSYGMTGGFGLFM